ncbi:PREDICTED: uncharacterized protein LOC105368517 isoform X2 [Ceratosolen solmsi marchali]|nr:PREDICTED: uncharacterized protein LOC105368517 isoform X2 [Ceratosolen solmsi marchali]
MSKRDGNKMLVHQLSSVLPDDRPITAINIIEDLDKCPPNFTVVSRTYDLDSDADLWRDSGLFIKKKSRYICFSKTEGLPHSVIEKICIIDEREPPPEGFSIISHTVDSMQKAWRKRQVCYKIRNKNLCTCAVTDIIICNRIGKGSKIAPNEFTYAGVINGVYICYKTVPLLKGSLTAQSYANIELFQTSSPTLSNGTPRRPAPERPPKSKFLTNGLYSQISPVNAGKSAVEENSQDYEVLSPTAQIKPTRPAPNLPSNKSSVVNSIPTYGTLPGSSDLDGVPFVLNSILIRASNSQHNQLPVIKIRTRKELDNEYFYDFRTERET